MAAPIDRSRKRAIAKFSKHFDYFSTKNVSEIVANNRKRKTIICSKFGDIFKNYQELNHVPIPRTLFIKYIPTPRPRSNECPRVSQKHLKSTFNYRVLRHMIKRHLSQLVRKVSNAVKFTYRGLDLVYYIRKFV